MKQKNTEWREWDKGLTGMTEGAVTMNSAFMAKIASRSDMYLLQRLRR